MINIIKRISKQLRIKAILLGVLATGLRHVNRLEPKTVLILWLCFAGVLLPLLFFCISPYLAFGYLITFYGNSFVGFIVLLVLKTS